MERKLAGECIGGGGWDETCHGRKMSAKGQHGNGCIGSEGMKPLGTGGRVSAGWLRQGGVKCVRMQKGCVQCVRMLTCPSGRIGRGPFPSGRNKPCGPTQNRSLRYKRLERPVHRVRGERQNARYFFC